MPEDTSKSIRDTSLPSQRPLRRGGVTFEVETGYGKLFVTVNSWAPNGEPLEIFGAMSKANPETSVQLAALCRLASRALQAGLPPSEIIASWRGLTGSASVWNTVQSPILPAEESPEEEGGGKVITRQIRSLPDALAVVLELYEKEREYLAKEARETFRVRGVEEVPEEEVVAFGSGKGGGVTAGDIKKAGYVVLRRLEAEDEEASREAQG